MCRVLGALTMRYCVTRFYIKVCIYVRCMKKIARKGRSILYCIHSKETGSDGERERKRNSVYVCLCMCVREKEGESEK